MGRPRVKGPRNRLRIALIALAAAVPPATVVIGGAGDAEALPAPYALNWENAGDRTMPDRAPSGWGKQWCCSHSVTIATDHVRSGQYAAKFVLNRSDPSPWPGGSSRAELAATGEPANADRWYGFSIFLPGSYVADKSAEIVTQWHQQSDYGGSPPLALATHNGAWELEQYWENHDGITPLGTYATNRWTDWVLHVRWSAGSNGVLEVWRDGVKVFDRAGKNKYDDGAGVYLKIGIYKWDWAQNPGKSTTTQRVMYHDELRVAGPEGGYQAVAPR